MRRIFILVVGLFLLAALGACTAGRPLMGDSSPVEPAEDWELQQWQSPQFDLLRSRMPVHGRDVTFEMLNTTARISPAERHALAAWAEIALQAQRRTLDTAWAGEPPEVIALGEAARSRYASNLLELYNGVVTWGEFNRRTLTIAAELENSLAQVRSIR